MFDLTGTVAMSLAEQTEAAELFPAKEIQQLKRLPMAECISAHHFAGCLLISDIVILFLTGCLPAVFYSRIDHVELSQYMFVVVAALPLLLLTSQALTAYETTKIFTLQRTLWRGAAAFLLVFFVVMVAGIATKSSDDYSRIWFFSWFGMSLLLNVTVRVLAIAIAEAKLARGACLRRAIIISCGEQTISPEQLALETGNRIRAVGAIAVRDLSSFPDLGPYLKQLSPEIVVLCLPWSQVDSAMGKLKILSQHSVEILVLPQTLTGLQKVLRLRRLGNQTFLQIAEPPLAEWDWIIKRAEDVVISALALFILSPILLVTVLAIKLESRGPVLFKQMRSGFNGDLIEVWKFRSMYVEETDPHAVRQTSRDDPRVTRVGRFIRRTSIDELPQFWNVLQGRMSVVGPRPHALKTSAEGQLLEAIADGYVSRHRVKPGITGWAQVNGARGELRSRDQVKKRVEFDLHYIENWSVFFDIRIILMTFVKVVYDSRAY
jgi:Undecaprenyl-phosphate glucose phosphotransferase